MSSPGFDAPTLERTIASNSNRRKNPSNLRAYWQDIKAFNESEIHDIETTPARFLNEGEHSDVVKKKLAIKSFPGRLGPTLDQLSAAFRKGDQKETKWLAHRALCISESRLEILEKSKIAGCIKVALMELNEILVKLKTDGIQADIGFIP